ncbi:hypothetical protein [Curtobacterium sp. VKM Ac-1376]|uniref:hypothetical protein n=1 Tax=Curtobacterium sp. VKM Ac-1376 TaxID=123312 RepID=UPI00188CEEE4|nr:hypothetical protein [Curtobacterium sp. VKM Ac-1376]MBF4614702.1 hypothetical protein [Curtobacterium sp. VKM Ac-1376]
MGRTRTVTTAVIGSALVGLLLTGCTAFGGDDAIPTPTRQATERTAEHTPDPTLATDPVEVEQVLPTGTVAAETDVVSPSGDTSIHVRVVANDSGTFDAQLSHYRTTNPQPMRLESGTGPRSRSTPRTARCMTWSSGTPPSVHRPRSPWGSPGHAPTT